MIGVFAAAAVTAAVAAHSRAPTRSRCPECGGATSTVLLPPFLRRNRFVHLRWCPRCEWQGLGRNGPEHVPGRRVAHASGFHWGDARFRSDSGFEFRRRDPPPAQPPHHPSGFRFGEGAIPRASADHPSGFRFGARPAPEGESADHSSGFRFAGETRMSGIRPASSDGDPESGKPKEHPSGFRWAEASALDGFRFREPQGRDGTGSREAGPRGERSA